MEAALKRDMDLIRELLLKLESWPMERGDVVPISPDALATEDHSPHEIEYHLTLLKEAGFVDFPQEWEAGFYFRAITWRGHEFLDTVRNPEIWRETKSGVAKIGGASAEFVWEIAKGYVKHLAKEKLGI